MELPCLWCIVVLLPQKRFFERFWMNLSSPLTVPYNRRTREESLFWKGSSAGAIFTPKIASLRFQTSQHKGQKIHDSSRTFQSKIYVSLKLTFFATYQTTQGWLSLWSEHTYTEKETFEAIIIFAFKRDPNNMTFATQIVRYKVVCAMPGTI